MRTVILRSGIACLIASAIFSCQSKVETASTASVDENQIKSEIESMEETFASSLNSRNLEGLLAYYSDDAESYEHGQAPMIGKKAIREAMAKQLTQMPKGVTIAFKTKDVNISSTGDQVVETGNYTVSDSTDTKMVSGTFLAVFEKKDGKYLCVREMIVADPKDQQ